MAYLQANVLSAYVFLAPAIVAGVVTLGVMQQQLERREESKDQCSTY